MIHVIQRNQIALLFSDLHHLRIKDLIYQVPKVELFSKKQMRLTFIEGSAHDDDLLIRNCIYLLLHLLIQISPQNHNCKAFNVFFTDLSHNNARSQNGHRTVRERSEYSMTVLSHGSARARKTGTRHVSHKTGTSHVSLPLPSVSSYHRRSQTSILYPISSLYRLFLFLVSK